MQDLPLFQSHLKEPPLTVSQLNQRIKFVLEDEFLSVRVIGQISSFKRHQSGHLYFELKDSRGRISAVMFRGQAARLDFRPAEGLEIEARGKVSVYGPQGKYQIIVSKMKEVGVGDLELKFRQLKEKLLSEGLFATTSKKPLPTFPKKIGVATSSTGAALRDILNVLGRRNPLLSVVIRPTLVQGADAARDIVQALKDLDSCEDVEAIIVGRGGGSYEDLFVFNDEQLARTIFSLKTPVISAVGHEVDFTISDFVADVRAATPTDAAQRVTPEVADISRSVSEYRLRIDRAVFNRLTSSREALRMLHRNLSSVGPVNMVQTFSQRIDELQTRLQLSVRKIFEQHRSTALSYQQQLKALAPMRVLERGYSIVKREDKIIDSCESVSTGESIEIILFDGSIGTEVLWTKKTER